MVDDAATLFAVANRHLSCSAAKPRTANPQEPRAIMVPTWQPYCTAANAPTPNRRAKEADRSKPEIGPAGRLFQGQPVGNAGDEGSLPGPQGRECRIVGPAQDQQMCAAVQVNRAALGRVVRPPRYGSADKTS